MFIFWREFLTNFDGKFLDLHATFAFTKIARVSQILKSRGKKFQIIISLASTSIEPNFIKIRACKLDSEILLWWRRPLRRSLDRKVYSAISNSYKRISLSIFFVLKTASDGQNRMLVTCSTIKMIIAFLRILVNGSKNGTIILSVHSSYL